MTYTEFIKEIENNIAKANCNKLNIGEYEEKQKQIYKQVRAEVIDEVIERIKQITRKGILVIDKSNLDDISEQLKE